MKKSYQVSIKERCRGIRAIITISLLVLTATGCAHLKNTEYLSGYNMAESYAKADAINDKCINYPIVVDRNILQHTRTHIDQIKDGKSPDFIKGFSRGYRVQYVDYMNMYCDSMDDSAVELEPGASN